MECFLCGFQFAPHLDHEVRITFSLHERFRNLSPAADDPDHRNQIDERLGPTPGVALLTMPDFQRLFPQQRLLPDESLDVTRLALVFTDLAGSTALYARRGDPRAYHLVRLHFDELFRVADECNGTTVKTIGDAILAVFQSPVEAFCAANDMQNAIATLNDSRNLRDEERLILKVGLHSGPCLSVTLNDRPDFFGTTVNTAARVQGISRGNDVVFSEAVRSDTDVQKALGETALESQDVLLKGLDGPLLVHRLPR
jgi:class 3 adenylate cyclase